MKITEQHIKAAKLLIEGKLTQEDIGKECGITGRQIRNWLAGKCGEEFKNLMDELTEIQVNLAKAIMRRWSPEMAKRLIFLAAKSLDDEVSRKSANDILKGAGILIEQPEPTGGNNQILIIRSDGDEGKAKDKVEVLSGRFRL